MKLYELLEGKALTYLEDTEVKGITDDTRKDQRGIYLYV